MDGRTYDADDADSFGETNPNAGEKADVTPAGLQVQFMGSGRFDHAIEPLRCVADGIIHFAGRGAAHGDRKSVV